MVRWLVLDPRVVVCTVAVSLCRPPCYPVQDRSLDGAGPLPAWHQPSANEFIPPAGAVLCHLLPLCAYNLASQRQRCSLVSHTAGGEEAADRVCKDARIDASLRVSVGLEPPPPEPAAGGLPPLLRRRPAALIGPGLGLAMPPCPDGAAHGRLGLRSAARHRRCPRRPHRPGPGTGNAASPGRCKTQVTRTGARVALGPTARLPHRLGQGPALPPSPVGARCR